MRIARLGNLFLPVPAEGYGGTERSMAQMTVLQAAICGHDITLYAATDSKIISFARETVGKMGLTCVAESSEDSLSIMNADGRVGSIRLKSAGIHSMGVGQVEHAQEFEGHKALFAEFLADEQREPFEIIHCHTRRFMTSEIIPRGLGYKTIVHQHNAGLEPVYQEHLYPLICISNRQAKSLQELYNANVFDVIHHGLDSYAYSATIEHAGYLAWIGRFLIEKGAHRAIKIAKSSGKPLVIAGMTFDKKPESALHFEEDVRPYIDIYDPTFLSRIAGMTASQVRVEIAKTGIDNPIIFCGEADELQKQALFGHAEATLFPISWEEPFGRVLIESMGCGTPVIGYAQFGAAHCGSVAEVIENEVTGYSLHVRNEADGIQKAIEAVDAVSGLDRRLVREVFDRDWTSTRVARQLDDTYARFLKLTQPEPSLLEREPEVPRLDL